MDEQNNSETTSFTSKVSTFILFMLKQFLFGGIVAVVVGGTFGLLFTLIYDKGLGALVGGIFAVLFGIVIPILSTLDIVTLKKPKWMKIPKAPLAFLRRNKVAVASVSVLLIIIGFGYYYYTSLPQPVAYQSSGNGPSPTPNSETLKPNPIYINFRPINTNGASVSRSVAKLDLVNKVVPNGIKIRPEIKGVWRWNGEQQLEFKPQQDWPAGQKYRVTFTPSIFKPNILLNNVEHQFYTPEYKLRLSSFKLYQDPKVKNSHKVTATLKATHPTDIDKIKKKLKLKQPLSGKNSGETQEYKFDVTYDKNQREIYIISEKIKIQPSESYMYFELDSGVKPLLGNSKTKSKIKSSLSIPSVDNFFKVKRTNISLVKNENDESEQALIIDFTDQISSQDIIRKTTAYLLPRTDSKGRKKYWNRTSEITREVLQESQKIKLKAVPTVRDTVTLHSFTFDVAERRQMFVRLGKGLKSTNDFIMANAYERILQTPSYPKELKIMSEGAILSKNGDHKLSFLTRGIRDIEVKIARIHENQINHLVSQTNGRITNPNFKSYYFNEQNISTLSTEHIRLRKEHPKKAVYSSFDFSDSYNPSLGLGLFIIDAKEYDPARRSTFRHKERRLILITDLGVLVKNNADGSHDLFVQSIETGKPVANTKISLLAKNGIAILTAKTDAKGHAYFPITTSFKKEKAPVAFVAKKGADVSFIPFNRYDRSLNYSRFNIGGIRSSQTSNDKIDAFVFSSRGIYRPGDDINLAAIVKKKDFSALANIPLELRITDPRGSTVFKKRVKLNSDGLIDFKFKTDPSSLTGSYYASVRLIENNRSRQLGSTSFKVEEFQADRLKIKSQFSDFKSKGWVTASKLKAQISLENLFGSPAQNRKIIADLKLTPSHFYFKEYSKYNFSNSYANNSRVREKYERLDETKTNEEGKAEFDIDLKNYEAGTYRLNLSVRGFEESGGRSVNSNSELLVSPAKALIGYKADGSLSYITRNSKRLVNFININSDVEKRSRTGLHLRLTQQQYISTLVRQNNGTYKYQSVRKDNVLKTEDFSITSKGNDYRLPSDTPGVFLLEVIDDKGTTLSRLNFSVIGAGNLAGKLERNAELQVRLNKSDYKSGEKIEMSIVAPYTGSGLITIETNKVHAFKWFKSTTTSSVQSIRLPEGIEGNAYVNVSFVRSADSKEIFTSPLSYSVQPFSVDRTKRTIALDLNVPKKIKPGEDLTISYRSKKPSSIVLFAVDEGILQVAKYKTPKPLNHFLQKRALEVNTMQMVDLILPAFRLVQESAASGGGASIARSSFMSKQLNPFSRKVDKPVAYWSGILPAGPAVKEHTFKVPDTFSGTLRVMAVAVNTDGVGVQESKTLVRGPFVLTPNVLTSAAPGDEFDVVLGIANILEGSGKALPIKIDISTSEHLQVLNKESITVNIDENSEDKLKLRVKVLDKLGAASISFVASSGDKTSRRTATLSVRPAMPYSTTFESGLSKSGEKEFDIPRELYPNLSTNTITASQSPLALTDGLMSYLTHYPHSSTEQKISASYPLLNYLDHPSYMGTIESKYTRLNSLISTLRKRQVSNGGFTNWSGSNYSSTYLTLHVMNFLLDAKDKGIAIPNDMWQKGFTALRKFARISKGGVSSRNRAYAIYLLTRKGDITSNYLFDLERTLKNTGNDNWHNDIVSAFIGATYKLMLVNDKAASYISYYEIGKGKHYDYWSNYDSQLTHDSQYIYLLAKHFPEQLKDLDKDDLLTLVKPIFKGKYNTLSSAWSVLAMSAYSDTIMPKGVKENVKVTAFKSNKSGELEKEGQLLTVKTNPYPVANFFTDIDKLTLAAQPNSFYMLSQSGFDMTLPKEASSKGLEVVREFQDKKGNKVSGNVTLGDELTVVLRIRSTTSKDVVNVAVVDLLPGGFEVITDSIRNQYNGWKPTYKDIREDRVVFYGRFGESMTVLSYKVKVTSSGTFIVPPAYAESMYDLTIKANSKPDHINVNEP